MIKKNILLPLLLTGILFCKNSVAQSFTFSGYISDAKTNERLIGANVFDPVRKVGTATNAYGFFSITLTGTDSARLMMTYVGYAPEIFSYAMTGDQEINVLLSSSVTLGEIVVTGARTEQIQNRSQMSEIDLTMDKLKNIPALFGEADLLKAIQLLPGIQGGGEGSTGLYVRGGGPDQNLILLDGAPVYNVSHLFGFFSVFNPDAIKNVSIFTGGFPARYGGRLSSVIDIAMKDGNQKDFTVDASIGVISSKLTMEGPIKKNKSSFIISVRRTYIDILARPLIAAIAQGEGTGGYYFYDLNGKVNHTLNSKNRIYLSGYLGDDKFYANSDNSYDTGIEQVTETDKFKLGWGNITSTLRWNHQFNKKTFNNLSFIYTKFKFNVGESIKTKTTDNSGTTTVTDALNYISGVQDYSIKNDLDWIPTPHHFIKIGVGYTYHNFKTGAYQFKSNQDNFSLDTTIGSPSIYAHEGYLYIEDDWEISSRLKANIGLHYSADLVKTKIYSHPEPRISLRYLINENISIKASFCTMQQYIHLLANSNIGLPTDLWVPATDKVPAQNSWQPALGYSQSFKIKDQNCEWTLEGYYKDMQGVIDYLGGANFLSTAESWEEKVAKGHAWSYGAELFVQKKTGKFTGWVGYTLSWSWRQFDDINFGKKFPYKYDRRNDIEIVGTYKLTDNCDLGITWVFGTGNAITLPVAKYFDAGNNSLSTIFNGGFNNGYNYYNSIDFYGEKNSTRMRAYHRLDIGFNWHKTHKWGERIFSLGIYNVYSRKNPYFYYLGNDKQGNPQYKMVSLFPIIPSVSYSLHFN